MACSVVFIIKQWFLRCLCCRSCVYSTKLPSGIRKGKSLVLMRRNLTQWLSFQKTDWWFIKVYLPVMLYYQVGFGFFVTTYAKSSPAIAAYTSMEVLCLGMTDLLLNNDLVGMSLVYWQNLTSPCLIQTSFSIQERIWFAVGAVMNIKPLLSTVVSNSWVAEVCRAGILHMERARKDKPPVKKCA